MTEAHLVGADKKARRARPSGRALAGRRFYASNKLAAEARGAVPSQIHISIHPEPADLQRLTQAAASVRSSGKAAGAAAAAAAKRIPEALRAAAAEVVTRSFAAEISALVDAYRVMLRESLATGDSPELQAALNRARLQERILASTPMVDQAQACRLLGLSEANPSATMKRKEDKGEVLRFTLDGRAMYPLFQFDVEGRRVHPVMASLIERKPAAWSDFRLLHWLTRPHLDFERSPAEAFATEPDEVLAALAREAEPPVHG